MEEQVAEKHLPEDESSSSKSGSSVAEASSFNESTPVGKGPPDVNCDDEPSDAFHCACDAIQPPLPLPRLDIENNSTQETQSSSNQNQSQLCETSEVTITKDADNNEIGFLLPQEIPQTREVRAKTESCSSLYEIDESSEVSSMGSLDSTDEDDVFGNSSRNLHDRFSHFLGQESISETESEASKMVMVRTDVRHGNQPKSRRSSSSLLLTVHVSDSYLKFSDLDSSSSLFETRKLQFELEDSDREESDAYFLHKDAQIPTKRYDRRFRVAWKMTDLYNQNKKATVDTPIPLTGTSMFTQRISFCKRFCRRLKASSLCCCFSQESSMDGLTRQESIEAFHNEIHGLGADERPEGDVGGRRRANVVGATKSMKLVQKLHSCDKPGKKRMSR